MEVHTALKDISYQQICKIIKTLALEGKKPAVEKIKEILYYNYHIEISDRLATKYLENLNLNPDLKMGKLYIFHNYITNGRYIVLIDNILMPDNGNRQTRRYIGLQI